MLQITASKSLTLNEANMHLATNFFLQFWKIFSMVNFYGKLSETSLNQFNTHHLLLLLLFNLMKIPDQLEDGFGEDLILLLQPFVQSLHHRDQILPLLNVHFKSVSGEKILN